MKILIEKKKKEGGKTRKKGDNRGAKVVSAIGLARGARKWKIGRQRGIGFEDSRNDGAVTSGGTNETESRSVVNE